MAHIWVQIPSVPLFLLTFTLGLAWDTGNCGLPWLCGMAEWKGRDSATMALFIAFINYELLNWNSVYLQHVYLANRQNLVVHVYIVHIINLYSSSSTTNCCALFNPFFVPWTTRRIHIKKWYLENISVRYDKINISFNVFSTTVLVLTYKQCYFCEGLDSDCSSTTTFVAVLCCSAVCKKFFHHGSSIYQV